jgi:hypothetical protein
MDTFLALLVIVLATFVGTWISNWLYDRWRG